MNTEAIGPILTILLLVLEIVWPYLAAIAAIVILLVAKKRSASKRREAHARKQAAARKQGRSPHPHRAAQPSPPRKIKLQSSQPSTPYKVNPWKAKKGEEGEVAVFYALSAFTKARGFHRYHNLIIPDGRGGTTEVDAVILSRFGVFVLEIKNYSGKVSGTKNAREWTHTLRDSKRPFPNPLRQNHHHIRALQTLTGLPGGCFCNIVVFTGSAEFQTPMPPGVVHLSDLAESISATAQTTLLTDAQVQNAIMVMLENNQANKRPDAATQHHNYVREMHR